jgi:hypothetical protein
MKIIDAIRARIEKLNRRSKQRLFLRKMKLQPQAIDSFMRAWEPLEPRETPSTFECTSRGASWWPRRLRFISKNKYYATVARNGNETLRRNLPKRDKSISARQAKRMRMAGLREA